MLVCEAKATWCVWFWRVRKTLSPEVPMLPPMLRMKLEMPET